MKQTEIQKFLKPLFQRQLNSNKYDYGHVLIIGGSPGMVGAPLLAGKAALRVGAGLVTIASSKAVTDKLEHRVEEIMVLALPKNTVQAMKAITKFISERHVTTLVIGPGLGITNFGLVREVVQVISLPMVLDASGITAFRGHIPLIRKASSRNPDIALTPHTGEYERLTETQLPANVDQIKKQITEFATANAITVVLKGHNSLVVSPEGQIYENQTGNPGLATAGTGDVLSGVIAGLLAQNINSFYASEAGVYIHGLAADVAAQSKTEPGIIASDIIDYIPRALKKIKSAI
jgi:hydroxyethylthiazole kinase-like uncharacterized protein yjeF